MLAVKSLSVFKNLKKKRSACRSARYEGRYRFLFTTKTKYPKIPKLQKEASLNYVWILCHIIGAVLQILWAGDECSPVLRTKAD